MPLSPPTPLKTTDVDSDGQRVDVAGEAGRPAATGLEPDPAGDRLPGALPVIGRIDAFGYEASSWANEHGAASVHAFPTLTPPTIALPVCHQPDGAVCLASVGESTRRYGVSGV